MSIGFAADAQAWDRAYSNRDAVPDVADWMAVADEKAARFTAANNASATLGVPYAEGPRRDFDLFTPEGPVRGTMIFIHGGYWRAGTKEAHHHFAAGALARGWRVAMPEYPLCPDVRISEISALMAQAVEAILTHCPKGEVILSGHSAGGQLATWVVSADSGLSGPARARIGRVVSLSGLHDLRPLTFTADLNGSLHLDAAEARVFSPALGAPGHDFELYCVCGGSELPEFLRQNALLANIWQGFGLQTQEHYCEGRNHFTLLDLMSDPESAMTALLTGGKA